MILRELQIGDRFISARAKDKQKAERFTVRGMPEFNRAAGTATRKCQTDKGGGLVDKQCRLEVIKLASQNAQNQTPPHDTNT